MPEITWIERLKKLQEERFRPGVEPVIPPRAGDPYVRFDIPWSRLEVGWDIAARAWARALALAGADVRLPPIPTRSDEVAREAGHLGKPCNALDIDIRVWSGSFATAQKLGRAIRALPTKPKTIFHTMFERQDFDPAIASSLARLVGVWVPCSANREALEALGLKNVRHFGVPHFDDDELLRLEPPREAKSFYWIGSWSPHKAPDNLIRAFMRAFCPGDATLTIKRQYVHRSMPAPETVAAESFGTNGWTKENWSESIRIESRTLSGPDLIRLIHAPGDVYVSASRGEGFDMPAYAAKLAKRRVITTDSGGPRDFLGSEDILIPSTGKVPVHPDYTAHGWEHSSTYADYDLEKLVEAMARVRSEPPVQVLDWPRDRFRAQHIGNEIVTWMKTL